MRIGILADSHNHSGHLLRALGIMKDAGIDTVIHCGDLAAAATAVHLQGVRVIYVNGNSDVAPQQINRTLRGFRSDNVADITFRGEIGGAPIAAAHGHQPHTLQSLVRDGRFAYVFHGHTHRRRDEIVGQTRIINPGALGGTRYEPRSCCLLDLETGIADFVEIATY